MELIMLRRSLSSPRLLSSAGSSRVSLTSIAKGFFSSQSGDSSLHVSLFKNPIVHQLWTARQAARRAARENNNKQIITSEEELSNGKPPSASRVEVSYPFSSDALLLEAYKNPWGQMRFGKMMEDLDALAGNIAFFHVDCGQDKQPVIVTASFDRIRLRQRPQVGSDQYLSGQVTWTGSSSMEIRMQCADSKDGKEWLEAYVTFVALDPDTKKPTRIPPLKPETDQEKLVFEQGAARAALKKKRRQQQHVTQETQEMDQLAQSLLQQAGPLLNMPSLADPHSILLSSTRMQNAMIAQPQVQNLSNRIFGGFLMRRAFELAFSNAYVFGGARPIFLEVDEVSFASPVDVGDLLVFNSRVLYTERGLLRDYYTDLETSNNDFFRLLPRELPLVHVEVEAWVTEPEKVSARMSNQFYFTYAIVSDKTVRKVLPSNIDEARRMASRILADREQLGR